MELVGGVLNIRCGRGPAVPSARLPVRLSTLAATVIDGHLDHLLCRSHPGRRDDIAAAIRDCKMKNLEQK